MNYVKAIAIVLFVLPLATAAEPPKAALTEKEIAEGYLQLFDGETTYGWKIEGDSKIKDGVWTLGGGKATKATYLIPFPNAICCLTNSTTGEKTPTMAFSSAVGEPMKISERAEKGVSTLVTIHKPKTETTCLLSLEVPIGSQLIIHRCLVLTEHGDSKPLFNGKDLEGWQVFSDPKRKLPTEFTVTKEGEIHAVNGPGDLQTKAKYADFLLQFQCKTNGDSLNSGFFFRCIEGQYQQGYECQIHNGMVDKDPTKPKDFGTGAIYRRQAARKIVAKDKEWFSATLVAHGDRFATWVNGYPTLHWQDERKADANPRNGLRKEAGHLSIQGHDPTTDILFKDLKLVEFPKK